MKKLLLAAMLTVCMIFTFSGCSSSTSGGGDDNDIAKLDLRNKLDSNRSAARDAVQETTGSVIEKMEWDESLGDYPEEFLSLKGTADGIKVTIKWPETFKDANYRFGFLQAIYIDNNGNWSTHATLNGSIYLEDNMMKDNLEFIYPLTKPGVDVVVVIQGTIVKPDGTKIGAFQLKTKTRAIGGVGIIDDLPKDWASKDTSYVEWNESTNKIRLHDIIPVEAKEVKPHMNIWGVMTKNDRWADASMLLSYDFDEIDPREEAFVDLNQLITDAAGSLNITKNYDYVYCQFEYRYDVTGYEDVYSVIVAPQVYSEIIENKLFLKATE